MTGPSEIDVVVHFDWSVDPAKRWSASAKRDGACWFIDAPQHVTTAPLDELSSIARTASVLAGFDFPIGVPQAWATKAGIVEFREFLAALAADQGWSDFFRVADEAGQIAIRRPFYPHRPKGARQRHLLDTLGLSKADLFRVCEHKTDTRRAACPLFWLVGANQVGRAALSGWREILIPALGSDFRLWPFDTDLSDVQKPGLIITETYPADAYGRIKTAFEAGQSKRYQVARESKGRNILEWAERHRCVLSEEARDAVINGFGDDALGEDRFDAFVGLCGMLDTLLEGKIPYRPDGRIRAVEGWIFGQPAPAPIPGRPRTRRKNDERPPKKPRQDDRYVTVELLIRILMSAMKISRLEAERIVSDASVTHDQVSS